MLNSPLEQSQILPLFSFGVNLFDFSMTNVMRILCIGLGFFFYSLFVAYGRTLADKGSINFLTMLPFQGNPRALKPRAGNCDG